MPSRKSTEAPIVIEVPVARSKDLLIERVGDELVIYNLQDKQAHCLRALAASVFNRCDGKTAVAEIAPRVEADLSTLVTESDVRDAISQLEASGLLETPLRIRNGLSRRDAVKRFAYAGAAGALAGPLINSIAAPSTAMALSNIPTGCTGCGANKDCASNHCCQTNAGKQCNQSCCVASDNSCHFTNVCSGGSNAGGTCTSNANCPGGTCILTCTVCASTSGCTPPGTCPCQTCPPGSNNCCTPTC
jgi:hypothetical protein